jgi:DNA polymerase-1
VRTLEAAAKVRGKVKMICAHCFEIVEEVRSEVVRHVARTERAEAPRDARGRHGALVDVLIPGAEIVRGRCGYSQWLNNPFQGLGGTLAKDATWRVSKEMHTDPSSPLWGSHLNLMVHDELIAEAPLERLHEAAERVSRDHGADRA